MYIHPSLHSGEFLISLSYTVKYTFYIGQTGNTLEQRNKQHKCSVRTGQQYDALFIHVIDTNHSNDLDNCKKVNTSKSSEERNIMQSSLIKHTHEDNINLSEGLFKLDNYITSKISKNVLSYF